MKIKKYLSIYLAMLVIYIVSRFYVFNALYFVADLFSERQLLDILQLQNHLIESIYYLHDQPPLFNLMVGSVIKLFPGSYLTVLSLLYLVMSFALYAMMFRIFLFFKVPPWGAFVLATLYILSPEALLYERWISVLWLSVFLLVLSLFFLVQYVEKKEKVSLLFFFLAVTALILTNMWFSLLYLLGVVLILVVMQQRERKQIVLLAVIPFLLISGLYIKNNLLFGVTGSSSMSGMGMAKKAALATLEDPWNTIMHLPEKQKEDEIKNGLQRLYNEGKIQSRVWLHPFDIQNLCQYAEKQKIPERWNDITVLAAPLKINGTCNMNFYGNLLLEKEIRKDAFHILWNHPWEYLQTVGLASLDYFRPTWDEGAVERNRKKLYRYIHLFELGHIGGTFLGKYSLLFIFVIPLSFLLAFAYVGRLLYRHRKKRATVSLFMLYSILYLMFFAILTEQDGLNRIRVITDPLLYMLVMAGMVSLVRLVFEKRDTYV